MTARSPAASSFATKSRMRIYLLSSLSEAGRPLRFLPRCKLSLDVFDELHGAHAEQRHDDDGDEHLRCLEKISILPDHAPEAGNRGEELGDDHRQNGPADGEP